jgi:hypothetical protein
MDQANLTRFAWLSIGTAVLTIVLKALAYGLTGSVGLLSDALESLARISHDGVRVKGEQAQINENRDELEHSAPWRSTV